MPANNTGGMTSAMKTYKAEVAKRKSMYATSDRMNAAAKKAGKTTPKTRRSMPVNPLKRAAPLKKTAPVSTRNTRTITLMSNPPIQVMQKKVNGQWVETSRTRVKASGSRKPMAR